MESPFDVHRLYDPLTFVLWKGLGLPSREHRKPTFLNLFYSPETFRRVESRICGKFGSSEVNVIYGLKHFL